MYSLPPELQLKIARQCDFATANTLSKLNKHWERLISSNWNTLEKMHVEAIELSYSEEEELRVFCVFPLKDGHKKTLALKIGQGFDQQKTDCTWQLDDKPTWMSARTNDADAFLIDLFEPIFRKSTIHLMKLDYQKSSTLQTMIGLLKQHRTSIHKLSVGFGSPQSDGKCRELKQLTNAAEIVNLAKPTALRISNDFKPFTNGEVREHFLLKVARQKIAIVAMMGRSNWDEVKYMSNEESREAIAAGDFDKNSSKLPESNANMPLPRCRLLEWIGIIGKIAVSDLYELIKVGNEPLSRAKLGNYSEGMIFPRCSLLHWIGMPGRVGVLDYVELVKEWSHNWRDIVHYEFMYRMKFDKVAIELEKELRESNLPIRIEVVRDQLEYRIEKMEKRGDEQDEITITFLDLTESEFAQRCEYPEYGNIVIESRHGLSREELKAENFDKCRFCTRPIEVPHIDWRAI